jgi:cardiolipin synthase
MTQETGFQPGAVLVAIYGLMAVTAAGHALLTKRDPRAAWGWIAVCWLFPLAGALLYYVFGINRVQTRAQKFVGAGERLGLLPGTPVPPLPQISSVGDIELRELVRIGEAMSGWPLVAGNRVEALHNGEEAFPAMLEAIAAARRSIYLASYIFDAGDSGRRFVDGLTAAHARGVAVRVMVDGVADIYFRPSASGLLRPRGIPVADFLPPRLIPPMLHVNLRNHRKLLLVDGELAFTGGMNISDRHLVRSGRGDATVDLHFRVSGPVVQQMEEAFIEDWRFAAGEILMPSQVAAAAGNATCRVITDGPNSELNALIMVLLGALATAHRRVWIMTPYFIPTPELIGGLQAAALRGVEVDVILPERSNQPWADWAARNLLPPLLQQQVRVHLRPPPFAHTKMFLIDDYYAQIGSANMDERSLRLNFELQLEVYDPALVASLAAHFESVRAGSRRLLLSELESRPLPIRLRDALFWLFSAYL